MKPRFLKFALIAMSCAALVGCHRHDGDHHHDNESTESHSHGDDAQSFSGATHKEGEGITLLPETKDRLGIQVADAEERSIPGQITFGVRVFAVEETKALASAVIPTQEAQPLSPGTRITLADGDKKSFNGTVLKTIAAVAPGESEIVVQVPKLPGIEIGSFLQATVTLDSGEAVMTVPREAVIRGAADTFVYVQNGNAYLRTPVQVGRQTSDAVEIEDGLLEGDTVVSQGAMDLWLVELRAVKGGQGCCPAPPTKGKGK